MKKKAVIKEVISWVITIVVTLIITVFLNTFVLNIAKVDGESMANTLHHGDVGITWLLKPKLFTIDRFDIVVVDEKDRGFWVKRVVGLPNETIEYKNGRLFINDVEYPESFLSQKYDESIPKITLGADEYYVMGDNRYNSTDSRIIGPVKKSVIRSAGYFVLWPLERFGGK